MAAKKKRQRNGRKAATNGDAGKPRQRLQRSDDDKVKLVQQVLASGNQSAEIKKLGIYPNQFYDWKKRFASRIGVAVVTQKRGRVQSTSSSRTPADEAKAYLSGKASLLERLRAQRDELDRLIGELSR